MTLILLVAGGVVYDAVLHPDPSHRYAQGRPVPTSDKLKQRRVDLHAAWKPNGRHVAITWQIGTVGDHLKLTGSPWERGGRADESEVITLDAVAGDRDDAGRTISCTVTVDRWIVARSRPDDVDECHLRYVVGPPAP